MKKTKEKLAAFILNGYADIFDATVLYKTAKTFRLEADRIRRKHGLKIPKWKRKR